MLYTADKSGICGSLQHVSHKEAVPSRTFIEKHILANTLDTATTSEKVEEEDEGRKVTHGKEEEDADALEGGGIREVSDTVSVRSPMLIESPIIIRFGPVLDKGVGAPQNTRSVGEAVGAAEGRRSSRSLVWMRANRTLVPLALMQPS